MIKNEVMIRIINNMKFIIDNSDFRIGAIEKEADVSLGYLSRKILDITSDGASEGVSINFLYTFANHTGISIDTLVNRDLQKELADMIESVSYENTIGYVMTKIKLIQNNISDDNLWSRLSSAYEYLNKALELLKKQNSVLNNEQRQVFDKLSIALPTND
jgi:hypothetical protein